MNTPQDRANRIAGWTARGRDLLWIMSMIVVSHLFVLSLIGAQYSSAYIPLSVFLVFMTIMGIMGSLDAMDDIAAAALDADEEEKKTESWKRFNETQWGAFKGLLIIWFGGTALAELYVMWLA